MQGCRITSAVAFSLVLLMLPSTVRAQGANLTTVTYSASDVHFPNPERGFFTYTESFPQSPVLSATRLRAHRDESITLIWALYSIGEFRDKDLPESFLTRLDADFAAMREAGIKCVLRFRYALNMQQPDAPLEIVLRHLDQLQPVLERNYDVIAAANAGFIGAWGEWHASTHNLTRLENMRAVLLKFMDVLPKERAIQLRYPETKMQIFETSNPITAEEAFSGTDFARTGHHNDCFLASRDDVGTYRISPTWEKNYLNKDTHFVPMGGETCTPQGGTVYYHCENALKELAQMHWSFLNRDYYRGILQVWEEEGCMADVQRRLGYRFVLEEGRYTSTVTPGGTFRLELDLRNDGFASPYNPRGLQAVLRSVADPAKTYEVNLPSDPRFWTAGETQNLAFDLGIPETLPEGQYALHLFLPDPTETLRDRSEYAIRLANEKVWDEATGYNDLHHVVTVSAGAGGEAYGGTRWFVEREASLVSVQPEVPVGGLVLHPAVPNPFDQEARIRFELEEPTHVTVDVYDAMGRRTERLLDAFRPAGIHDLRFLADGRPSGQYFYQLVTSSGASRTGSMTLVR
ncbi:MAG TPA: DUF4832 domain-containing protein [Rhodothermales bacterium]